MKLYISYNVELKIINHSIYNMTLEEFKFRFKLNLILAENNILTYNGL